MNLHTKNNKFVGVLLQPGMKYREVLWLFQNPLTYLIQLPTAVYCLLLSVRIVLLSGLIIYSHFILFSIAVTVVKVLSNSPTKCVIWLCICPTSVKLFALNSVINSSELCACVFLKPLLLVSKLVFNSLLIAS